MALLLHLTDLHLGAGGADKSTADEKVKVIPPHEMDTRLSDTVRLVERVIEKLKGDRLSSIVISGDITVGNKLDGYNRLNDFIGRLSPLLPAEKGAVIAVPGNHDVAWGTEASSVERYRNFKQFVRDDLKATTPFLDGVDTLQKGKVKLVGAKKAYFANKEHGYAVVPLNTSNYCGSNLLIEGVTQPDIELFLEQAKGLRNGEAIVRSLERLTRFDIARVSPDQISAFEISVKSARQELKDSTDSALIISTFHHNLAPVSRYEEIKAFETLTNLGRLQETFTDLGVKIALHGHKHQPMAYWDNRQIVGGKATEMLVLSGASVGGEGYSAEVPFQLIEVNRVDGGHDVQVHSAKDFIGDKPAFVRMGLIHGNWKKPVSATDRSTIIEADTFDKVHEAVRNLPLFEDGFNHPLNNVVTTIRDGNSVTKRVPIGYPKDVVDDPNTVDNWFDEIAGWWQTDLSELSSDLYFTHGTRIKRYRGIVNQLEHAADVLKSPDPRNGRAIITLIDPESDFRSGNNKKRGGWFPAFSMAQAYITNEDGKNKLNIVGFYRKQEMRYWWAVNIRELRLMVDMLARRVKASIGSITTVATIAIADGGKPRVAVPVLDRWYDKDKGKIAQLVLSAVNSSRLDQGNEADHEKLALWRAIIADLVPVELPDGAAVENVPLATKGLELAHELLKAFSEFESSPRLSALTECLARIQTECASIVQTVLQKNTSAAYEEYDRSRKLIAIQAQEARTVLQEIFHVN
ncbi:metallophosphoesterase family protein [Rhizobium phaseoli]|uniref:metallophosphoesterase family protein n=1 Tax=Rhizobium phaseoli TaxID=396 RepID=UPI000BBAD095|nr:metallophosphoesterase [Rhizobium phaseoli]PCD67625.1 hypothetical protein CO648_11830 [Rhizobium phaseoli]